MRYLLTLLVIQGMCGLLLAQPVVAPTQKDNLILDNGVSNVADQNDKIRYEIKLDNTGTIPATGVQLNLSLDPNTTLVPGSIRTSPLALDDVYTCTGNVGITVSGAGNLLSNDFDDNPGGLEAISEIKTSAMGGDVIIGSNGDFTYFPPAGYTGPDNFTYTLVDGNPVGGPIPSTDAGTVSITVSNLIWFVDNSAIPVGDGRLTTPFNSLAAFNAGSAVAGDVIYIKHTGTNYSGGIVLQAGEQLIGEGYTDGFNLADVLPFVLSPNSNTLPYIYGMRPVLENAGGAGVSLAADNTLHGFDVGNCSGFGIAKTSAGTAGNLTVSEVSINNTTGGGFYIQSGGNLNVSLNSLSSGGGINGVSLISCTGTFNAPAGSIGGSSSIPFLVNGGNVNVTYGGSCTRTTSGGFIVITNRSGGSVNLSGTLTATGNSGGISISGATGPNTVSFGDVTLGTNASRLTGATAVSINNNAQAGATVSFAQLSIFTTSRKGLAATNGGSVNVTNGVINTQGGGATGVDISSSVSMGITLSAVDVTSTNTDALTFFQAGGSFTVTGNTTLGATGPVAGSFGRAFTIAGGTATYNISTSAAVSIDNVLANGSSAMRISGGAVVNFGPTTIGTMGTNTQYGVIVEGYTGPGVVFSSLTHTASAAGLTNIVVASSSGSVAINGGALVNTNGSGVFLVDGNSGSLTVACPITNSGGGIGVYVNGRTGGAVTFSGNINDSSGGIHVTNCTGGAITFSGASKTLNTATATAVNMTNNTGATINFTNGGLGITTTSGSGFFASGGGTINVSGAANSINVTTSGRAVDLDAVTTGIVFATVTTASTSTVGIDLTNLVSGSSFTVTGTTSITVGVAATNNINLNNCPNSTLRFGTDGVTPAAVDLANRRGTALLVNNCSGILLFGNTTILNPNNVGGYGIRIENSSVAATFASATISNTRQTVATADAGSDRIPDNDGDGDAIFLKNNTGSFTLNGGTLSNLATDGIDCRSCQNLSLNGVTITQIGVNSTNVATVDDAGIYAFNITGSNLVQNSEISRFEGQASGGAERGICILQTTGNNLTEFRINNTDFFNLLASGIRGDDAVYYRSEGAVNGKLVVENSCTFSNISGLSIEVDPGATAASSGTFEMDVLNSTFSSQFSDGSLVQGGIESQSQGNMNIDIEIRQCTLTGLSPANANAGVIHFAPQQNNGSFAAVVDDCDIIGTVLAPGAGRTKRGAINLRTGDLAGEQLKNLSLIINNCDINDIGDDGILLDIRGESLTGAGAGTGAITITNNRIGNVTPVGQDGLEGITIRVRNNLTTTNKTVNLLMNNNVVKNADNSTGDETVDLDAEDYATINATVTNNTFISNGLAQDEFRATTEQSTSTMCLDLRDNLAMQGAGPAGNGSLTVEEAAGALNLRHSGNAPAATLVGGITIIGIGCPTP